MIKDKFSSINEILKTYCGGRKSELVSKIARRLRRKSLQMWEGIYIPTLVPNVPLCLIFHRDKHRTKAGSKNKRWPPETADWRKPRCSKCERMGHWKRQCMYPDINRDIDTWKGSVRDYSRRVWNGLCACDVDENSKCYLELIDILALLEKATRFFPFDLRAGYWQVSVD